MRMCTAFCVAALLCVAQGASVLEQHPEWDMTELDEYVYRADPVYNWTVAAEHRDDDNECTVFVLDFFSQEWLSADVVSPSVWRHWLAIAVPDHVHQEHWDKASIHIGGGSYAEDRGEPPSLTNSHVRNIVRMAVATQATASYLFHVPNQPSVFLEEGRPRIEDGIIAYTWDHFYHHTNDTDWLLRMAMCKASVRGMDAIQELLEEEGRDVPSSFVVLGNSKRGWTAWLVAALDDRVVGGVPIVLDCLNFQAMMHHWWQNYEAWAFALIDYWAIGLTTKMDDWQVDELMRIVDPYNYRHRLQMPLYMITGSGDEFFQPDDARLFWNDMLGGNNFIYTVPNAGHGDAFQGAFDSIATFIVSTFQNDATELPLFSWHIDDVSGQISATVNMDNPPDLIEHVQATTIHRSRRDFRKINLIPPGPQDFEWTVSGVNLSPDGVARVAVEEPAHGWTGHYMMLTWSSLNFTATTEVAVYPDVYPFPDCHGVECRGILV